jgi:hypothetical protein
LFLFFLLNQARAGQRPGPHKQNLFAISHDCGDSRAHERSCEDREPAETGPAADSRSPEVGPIHAETGTGRRVGEIDGDGDEATGRPGRSSTGQRRARQRRQRPAAAGKTSGGGSCEDRSIQKSGERKKSTSCACVNPNLALIPCYEYATYIIRGPKTIYIVHVQGANMQETP